MTWPVLTIRTISLLTVTSPCYMSPRTETFPSLVLSPDLQLVSRYSKFFLQEAHVLELDILCLPLINSVRVGDKLPFFASLSDLYNRNKSHTSEACCENVSKAFSKFLSYNKH